MKRHRPGVNDRLTFGTGCARTCLVIWCLLWFMFSIESVTAWQPKTRPLTATPISAATRSNLKQTDSAASGDRAEPRRLSDVQTASFKEVVPGKSTVEDVTKHLGEPASQATGEERTKLIYKIAPFEKVEIVVVNTVVDSVVVYLAKPSGVKEVGQELGLEEFVPATIADGDGTLLGQVYPERGILLGFASKENDGKAKVAQIAIEQIDADSFLYRAKYNRGHQYLAAIEDLLYAQDLRPNDAELYALAGELLFHSGRFPEAAKHIDQAIKFGDKQPEHRLLKAKLLASQSKYAESVAEVRGVLETSGLSGLSKAAAHEHLGYLLAIAQVPNFQESLKNYTEAIKTANSLADDESREVRVAAKRISFDAHAGVADNIARGPWKRNHEVSQKWIGRAAEIADGLIQAGEFDESLLWILQQRKLTVLAGAMSGEDPTPIVDELVRLSKKLIADCQDPLFRARVQFQTGRALINAAQLEHWRRQPDSAIKFATLGAKLLEASAKQRDTTTAHVYRMGRAYFLVGSIHSILKRDHPEAVSWFAKAEANLRGPIPELYAYEMNIHGDRFVSMGVSYWQVGKRAEAVKLTKHGIDILEDAVRSGIAKPNALKIPYGNYGNMQKQMGEVDEAERYIERAAKLESPTPPTRR